ncbi:MAG: PTS sugar transporter subunit IIC [Lactovum sp.]
METKEKKNFVMEKILPPMMKFLNTKPVVAIKNGMIYPIPFVIIGSIFLILGQLPWQAGQDFMNQIKLGPLFLQINDASFGIMALLAAFGIAYSWVKEEGYEAAPAGLTAIIVHILLQPNSVSNIVNTKTSEAISDALASGVIDRQWLGGKGMILSILVGLFVGWLYTALLRRNFTIKMPEQVPTNVAASFTALVPAGLIITLAGALHGLFTIILTTTFIEWVYKFIQTPLQHVTDGPLGVFVIAFLPAFIWWFGVHGTTIVSGIMGPLLQANAADNASLNRAGTLDLEHGAHIVTQSFMDQYLTVTGTGLTLGFLIFMVYRAKSVQMKTIGRLEVAPAIFNINEPILFGMPIVLNPILAIPFMAAPMLSGILTYLAIYLHIIPPFNGAVVPWTTPAILSGYLVGGFSGMIWQILMLALSTLIWWPFAARYDKILLDQESEAIKK